MANSGRAEEALQYYHKALELNPLYIRARSLTVVCDSFAISSFTRFNLGISCINLRVKKALYISALVLTYLIVQRFEEAIHHILNALSLQESDAVSQGDNVAQGGVTTTALWDSLRTASISLQRPDLATFCDQQNLEGKLKA